jgi:hypothetical protein
MSKILRSENRRLAAFYYAFYNQRVDCNAIRHCSNMILQDPGVSFDDKKKRVATLLSIREDKTEILSRINTVQDLMLRADFLQDSVYTVISSFVVATGTEPENFQDAVAHAREFYDELVKHNLLVVSEAFYPHVSLYGLRRTDARTGIMRMEQLLQFFSERLNFHINSALAWWVTSSVFYSDSNEPERVVMLRDLLKKQRICHPENIAFSTLGILSRLPQALEIIVQQLQAVLNILKKTKGFGQLSVSRDELYYTAAMIIASTYLDEMKQNTGFTPEIAWFENIIIILYITNVITFGIEDRQTSVMFGGEFRV